MTTLREQIEADVGDVFLNTDDFAETCTYLPKSGGARSIVVVCEEEKQRVDDGAKVWLVTTLHVFCSRDTSEGIDAPQLGESICRENDHLPDGTPDPTKLFSYQGNDEEADDTTATSWTLIFERNRLIETGGNRLR
jgi:hypothetical protein